MKNEIIYNTFKFIVKVFYYINIVELFKYLFFKISKRSDYVPKIIAIDIYIILKWIFILLLITCHIENFIYTSIVIYLIVMNLFTYFYYHVWVEPFSLEMDKLRKRFINLIIAIMFSISCYIYLIFIPFKGHFVFVNNLINFWDVCLFTVSNAFLINYHFIRPADNYGYLILISESIITFIFFTIILSKTFYEPNKE